MGLFDFFTGDMDAGAGGAPAAGPEGGPSSLPPTPDDRAAARRAVEDQPLDEYGLHKPAVSWTERLVDYTAPPEVMNDPDVWWGEQIARGFLAAP